MMAAITSMLTAYKQFYMFRRDQKNDRYDSSRNQKLLDYISRQMQARSTKNSSNRGYSGSKPQVHINTSEMFSQPQIIKPRRGASIIRNSSKSKYAESMGKFRKDFIKDSYVNFDYSEQGVRKSSGKEEVLSITNGLTFDEEVGIQELHYQMVRLHQNVKKMQKDM